MTKKGDYWKIPDIPFVDDGLRLNVLNLNEGPYVVHDRGIDGETCNVKFKWESKANGISTGDGTAKININGQLKAAIPIKQGYVNINVAPYITDTTNRIRIGIVDSYGYEKWVMYQVIRAWR